LTAYGFGPVTLVLIVISVLVAIISKGGDDLRPIMGLFITESTASTPFGPAHFHSLRPAPYLLQHDLAARSRQHDRGAPVLVAAGAPGAGDSGLLEPGPVLLWRPGVWGHVRRRLRAARLHLDAGQVRSRLRLVSASHHGDDDDHLVPCLLYAPHPPRRQ